MSLIFDFKDFNSESSGRCSPLVIVNSGVGGNIRCVAPVVVSGEAGPGAAVAVVRGRGGGGRPAQGPQGGRGGGRGRHRPVPDAP